MRPSERRVYKGVVYAAADRLQPLSGEQSAGQTVSIRDTTAAFSPRNPAPLQDVLQTQEAPGPKGPGASCARSLVGPSHSVVAAAPALRTGESPASTIGVELLALAIYPFQPIGVVLRFVVVVGREIEEPAEVGLDSPIEFSIIALPGRVAAPGIHEFLYGFLDAVPLPASLGRPLGPLASGSSNVSFGGRLGV